MLTSSTGIAYDRLAGGTQGVPTVLFLHAGVADRRMWNPQWTALAIDLNLVRLDLRGFGESAARPPDGSFSHAADVLTVMDELGQERVHLVGSSFGAGVAVEVALTAPARVASLVLCPPGGSLITALTDALREFSTREGEALDKGDIDGAVEANVDAWLVGSGRTAADVEPDVVDQVRDMQRAALEASERLGDVEEIELEPRASERLAEITAPILVLTGSLDMDTIHEAAEQVRRAATRATVIEWPGTAHLPSLERPHDFSDLLQEWVARTAV